jgi:demethylmenaquinone methyltransferase/2-methoxy-6-polyprenyl-1,4-benzoquinol methylase
MWSLKKKARDYYASIASGYDELYGEEQLSKLKRALGRIDLQKSDIVLEVGCGTGLLVNFMQEKVGKIVGVDLSRQMVEKGRQRFYGEFLVCDAESLPFREGTFDKVLSFTVIQNLESPSKMLEEVGRVCRGIAAITVLRKGWSMNKFQDLVGKYLKLREAFEFGNDFFCICSA